MKNNNHQFDIIIAGGGLSGALAALSLSKLAKANGEKLSIAIVEANPILTDAKLTFDSRVLALSHGSAQYLSSLNVWHLLAKDAAPIKKIHISDRHYYGKARLSAEDHQVSALGYVIEMSLLGDALLNSLQPFTNITWFCPDSIEAIEWQQASVNITLNSAQQLSAKLLLACDGANSVCRQMANIATSSKSYEQCALIANVKMKNAHNHTAFERFTDSGPIAMLPLNDASDESKRCSLVWTLTPEQAERVSSLSDQAFKAELEFAFGSWLGAVEQVGSRVVYPLNLVRAKQQVYHRMVLVGNASHAIHPIAGQGFNLGLRDVEQLSLAIKSALENQQDIGQMLMLSEYEQQRSIDHQQVINITDSLVTLFSNQLPPLVAGRNIGLKVMNYCTPLKNTLVEKLMGY